MTINHHLERTFQNEVPMAVPHQEGGFERIRILRVFDEEDTVFIRNVLAVFNDVTMMNLSVMGQVRGETPWDRIITFNSWWSRSHFPR